MAMRLTALALLLFALTAQAQVARRVQGDGLVAWWTYDNLLDDALSTNKSVAYNSPVQSIGMMGGCLDGPRAAYLKVVNTIATNFTFTSWVWKRSVVDYGAFISGDGTSDLLFGYANLSKPWFYSVNTFFSTTKKLQLKTWTHVALSCSGSSVTLYINGKLEETKTLMYGVQVDLTLKSYFDGSNARFDGMMDDSRLYNRALTEQEIAALANSRRRNYSQ
jgi:hypothetical protein